ncbi:flagellar hook-length control protein FliK [Clostridium sp. D53t1_180928_C8]|uniref:flagellar hook-length control protein FliK n=1 Tax=Clostridium sp. D53t1_180928_C8 TaxID=2787101 RepID=UPI0018AB5C46
MRIGRSLALSSSNQNSANIIKNKSEDKFLSILDSDVKSDMDLEENKDDINTNEELILFIGSLSNSIKINENIESNEISNGSISDLTRESINFNKNEKFSLSIELDDIYNRNINEFGEKLVAPEDKLRKNYLVQEIGKCINNESIGKLIELQNKGKDLLINGKLNSIIKETNEISNENISDLTRESIDFNKNEKFSLSIQLDDIYNNNINEFSERLVGLEDKLNRNYLVREISKFINKESMGEVIELPCNEVKDKVINQIDTNNEVGEVELDYKMMNILDKFKNNNTKSNIGEEVSLRIKDIKRIDLLDTINSNTYKADNTKRELDLMKNIRIGSFKVKENNDLDTNIESNISNNIFIFSAEDKLNTNEVKPQFIRKEYFSEDVIQIVKYLKNNGVEELTVKINPKDLGEVNIKILKSKNEEKLVITLAKDETFSLVKENINEIKNHLSSLEINIKKIDVETTIDNLKNFSENLNQNFNRNNTKEQKRNRQSNKQENEIENKLENNNLNIDLLI